MESDRTGRIVLLNGTPSSGKTTLVRALQDLLPEPWIEIGIDRFVFALPKRYLNQPLWTLSSSAGAATTSRSTRPSCLPRRRRRASVRRWPAGSRSGPFARLEG